jgi:DNA polymerase III epsilon subunit family exonuclease
MPQALISKPCGAWVTALQIEEHLEFPSCVVVDLETNQRERGRHGAIIEVGISLLEGGSIRDVMSHLVNPDQIIDPRITQLTGIRTDMVQDAPRFGALAAEIADWTKDRIFVAHNVGFDYGHLRYHLARHGFKLRCDKLCTVKASRRLWPNAPGHSLGVLSQWLGIPLENHHRALDDARAAAGILQKLIEDFGPEMVFALVERQVPLAELPPGLDPIEVELLPDGPGVLSIRDQQGRLLTSRACNDLYQGFADLHRTIPSKQRSLWNSASRLDWRTMPSSLLGRILALHAQWKETPLIGRPPRLDRGNIPSGIYLGHSSTGCVFQLEVREGLLQKWILHRSSELGSIDDGAYFEPPMPIPAFLGTALRQGRMVFHKDA